MASRLFYILVTLFFLTMNFLLWKTDIAGSTVFGSRLSPDRVWEKVLSAAGESSLEIRYKGTKVGTARWLPSITQPPAAPSEMELDLPEGMIDQVSSYQLEFEGNCVVQDFRFRFDLHMKLSTNYAWQEMGLRLAMKPHAFEVSSVAAEQTVRFKIEDETGATERRYTFAELQHPDKILTELDQGWLPGALLATGVPLTARSASRVGLNWQARNDTLTVQHVHIRGYRLEAKLLDRQQISIFINPAGEVLRIDFPGDIVLVSDALTNL